MTRKARQPRRAANAGGQHKPRKPPGDLTVPLVLTLDVVLANTLSAVANRTRVDQGELAGVLWAARQDREQYRDYRPAATAASSLLGNPGGYAGRAR